MKTITVNTSTKYEILIDSSLLSKAGKICAEKIGISRGVIITDSNVDKLYSKVLADSLEEAGYTVSKFVFEAGESSKNAQPLINILEFLN